jgi:hypothetical protein
VTAPELDAIRARLTELGVDAEWATRQALKVGSGCAAAGVSLRTLLLFALVVADGCRSGLAADVVREIETLHSKADEESERQLNAERC